MRMAWRITEFTGGGGEGGQDNWMSDGKLSLQEEQEEAMLGVFTKFTGEEKVKEKEEIVIG